MKYTHPRPALQRGVTLIELLVGIVIGLLTIAVAMGALMVSRGVSGTVSDASDIQQQASYAFRVMGQQLRQAGSLKLKLSAAKVEGDSSPTLVGDRVAFETDFVATLGDGSIFNLAADTLNGKDSPSATEYKLTTGYRNYQESIYTTPRVEPASQASLQRNCLGENGTNALVQSRFVLKNNELHCAGTANSQALVRNVANFQVRYLMQTAAGTGNPQMRYVNATTVGATGWPQVFAVEVCLVLYGNEAIDLPTGSTYTDCDGTTTVDMSSAASTDMSGSAIGTQRARRMHMVFRNVYQLRSQGLAG
ncbi:PilW family protein [Acidovorax sp. A79]|uniref:PilW family protein n=1 Tax=Acidovorax sp. A79 TaxID=3056107 RepID=UPI0034E88D37